MTSNHRDELKDHKVKGSALVVVTKGVHISSRTMQEADHLGGCFKRERDNVENILTKARPSSFSNVRSFKESVCI